MEQGAWSFKISIINIFKGNQEVGINSYAENSLEVVGMINTFVDIKHPVGGRRTLGI